MTLPIIEFGTLNPINYDAFKKPIDLVYSTPQKLLAELALKDATPDSLRGSTVYRGIVLFKVSNTNEAPTGDALGNFINSIKRLVGSNVEGTNNPSPIRQMYYIRVPELDAAIPQPKNITNPTEKDYFHISLHRLFIAESTDCIAAEVGDIVNVRYGNSVNFSEPMYIGPVYLNGAKLTAQVEASTPSAQQSFSQNQSVPLESTPPAPNDAAVSRERVQSGDTIHTPFNTNPFLTESVFKAIMPNAPQSSWHVQKFNEYFERFEINTPARVSGFLGQIALESGQLRFLKATQKNRYNTKPYPNGEFGSGYVGRLGNANLDDARNYIERGYIQLVGKDNYRLATKILKRNGYPTIDLLANPEKAEERELSIVIAIIFFKFMKIKRNGDVIDLFNLIDQDKFEKVTELINGGDKLGAEQRKSFYRKGLISYGYDPDTGRKKS